MQQEIPPLDGAPPAAEVVQPEWLAYIMWAAVAFERGNAKLAQQCQDQATRLDEEDIDSSVSVLMERADLQHMMRRDPWHTKIFNGSECQDNLLSLALLPEKETKSTRSKHRRPVMGKRG